MLYTSTVARSLTMADVIAIGSYQADVVACCVVLWLMLLPFFVADVISTAVLADVIARTPIVSKEIAGHSNTVTPNGVGNA